MKMLRKGAKNHPNVCTAGYDNMIWNSNDHKTSSIKNKMMYLIDRNIKSTSMIIILDNDVRYIEMLHYIIPYIYG